MHKGQGQGEGHAEERVAGSPSSAGPVDQTKYSTGLFLYLCLWAQSPILFLQILSRHKKQPHPSPLEME